MGIGEERNDLYYLDPTNTCSNSDDSNGRLEAYNTSTCKLSDFDVNKITINNTKDLIWHQRLGHPFLSRIHLLPFISKHYQLPHCTMCPQSKQTRLSFPTKSATAYFFPFHTGHMDIWGPYNVATQDGERYFLTLVDDYTRTTWIYLMHYKFDVFQIIKNFVSLIRNQFAFNIKVVRLIMRLIFLKSECTSFFQSLGIIHQSSCP